jgi:hypothetical protein
VPTPQAPIESRIQDITEALLESRSPEVRESLHGMLDDQLLQLAEREEAAAETSTSETTT